MEKEFFINLYKEYANDKSINDNDKITNNILSMLDVTNIMDYGQVINDKTILLFACHKKLPRVALHLLKYPYLCNISYIDSENDTALLWACYNSMNEVALELLKYPSECKLATVDRCGCTALMWAINRSMNEVALKILKYPYECNLWQTSRSGASALSVACKCGEPLIAMKILKYDEMYNISDANNKNKILSIALNCAFEKGLHDVAIKIIESNAFEYCEKILESAFNSECDEDVILEILKYTDKFNINYFDSRAGTALIWACKQKMQKAIIKILSLIDDYTIDYNTVYNTSGLRIACDRNMSEIATLILKRSKKPNKKAFEAANKNKMYDIMIAMIEKFDMNQLMSSEYNGGCLIWACECSNENVALTVFEKMDKNNLGIIDDNGNNALLIAIKNNMTKLTTEILKYPKQCGFETINNKGESVLSMAYNKNMKDIVLNAIVHIYNLNDEFDDANEEHYDMIKSIKNEINIIKKRSTLNDELMKERITNKKCLFCGDSTKDIIMYSKCKHAIISCQYCRNQLSNNKCPLCQSTNNVIEKIFLCM